ncbi:anthranilate synthase component I [Barrientosiimonas marina]|uniref:Anthranilate synthase component 1 n=1 Tax=Lentibacillus kimchii TaxID=1542911 RepID=A0ABW2UV33_9BACI
MANCKYTELNADNLTPISIYENLDGRNKFLLESSRHHDEKGRYSFIGADPYMELTGNGDVTTIYDHRRGTAISRSEPVLHVFQAVCPQQDITLPFPFFGGAVGYIGHDAIRSQETIGGDLQADSAMPDAHLMLYQSIIVYDHHAESVFLVTVTMDQASEDILDERLEKLKKALRPFPTADLPADEAMTFQPEMDQAQFMDLVQQAKNHISQGDVFQIVLSQRMKAPITSDPFAYYRKLRKANPSPYMFYINFSDYTVLGASPESLVDIHGSDVTANPIAGTRPRGGTAAEDEVLLQDLTTDQKEIAEHKMLADLSQYDLGRICEQNSVRFSRYMTVEYYQHVMHMVSEVHGKLAAGYTSLDALQACLPAGTVSGMPKSRAMAIIDQLEDNRRGFYGGGVGYISFNHDLNMALAIRSLIIQGDQAILQTGAGIVADSDPASEYAETLNKAKALMDVSAHHVTSGQT